MHPLLLITILAFAIFGLGFCAASILDYLRHRRVARTFTAILDSTSR